MSTSDEPRSSLLETTFSSTGRDRRSDTRLTPAEFSTPASIRIPNRSGVSLVDLSCGGALLDVPFQIRPDARLTLEFRAASERMMLPFRMLRCYVASLDGGLRYQAAGAFERRLEWKPLLVDAAAQATTNRLIATLEAFLRHGSPAGRVVDFDQLLLWILEAARRGERADRIAVEIRRHLGWLVPSITIEPSTKALLTDPAKGARFFGLDFQCQRVLTPPDRRLLRAAAQLLSIVNGTGTVMLRPMRSHEHTSPREPAIPIA